MAIPSMDEILVRIQDDFIPSRYPYTYAYDLIFNNPDLIPAEVLTYSRLGGSFSPNLASRAGVAHVLGIWAVMEGVSEADLCSIFADAYLTAKGIIRQ